MIKIFNQLLAELNWNVKIGTKQDAVEFFEDLIRTILNDIRNNGSESPEFIQRILLKGISEISYYPANEDLV